MSRHTPSSPDKNKSPVWHVARAVALASAVVSCAGCLSAETHRRKADEAATREIASTRAAALGEAGSFTIERPADTLRRRLLAEQRLMHRTVPESDRPSITVTNVPDSGRTACVINLESALQIGAANSRQYQRAKEDLFTSALKLDLEKAEFRNTFSSMLSGKWTRDATGDDPVESAGGSATLGVGKRLLSGVELSGMIAVDLVKLLTQDLASSVGLAADASISIPILRGAGRAIAGEPLKQAERNLLYAVYTFERYKKSFAVNVASDYLSLLGAEKQVRNALENYRKLSSSAERARRLSDAGRLPGFQYDQAVQDELRARTRWMDALSDHESRLDSFKLLLGLPADADIVLDSGDLDKLNGQAVKARPGAGPDEAGDRPGPMEIEEDRAIALALERRLDLRIAGDKVEDARRAVAVAADALRAELTLLGQANAGSRRTSASDAASDDAELRPDRGTYSGLLTLDLAMDRSSERYSYRTSLISLDQAERSLEELEDTVKTELRENLRGLRSARDALLTQVKAVALAEKRVDSTDLFLQAGRAEVRDLLDAQEALLNARDALSSAQVQYRLGELRLQRDMEVLDVADDGLWREWNPSE